MLLFLPVKVFKIQIQPVADTDGCLICFYIVFSIYVFPRLPKWYKLSIRNCFGIFLHFIITCYKFIKLYLYVIVKNDTF